MIPDVPIFPNNTCYLYVKMDRLPLTDVISIDEVFMDMDEYCMRDLKEIYIHFNTHYAGQPIEARKELDKLIPMYKSSEHEIFREFGSLLEKYEDPIINSFIMVQKHGYGKIYDSRLSNGPIESINRKVKDLKRLGRDFRNFEDDENYFLVLLSLH